MSISPSGILFYEPRAKPLNTVGGIQPGSYYQFFLTGTTTQAAVYADGTLATPLSQSPGGGTTAASDGRFVPIYLDPNVVYRVQLYSATNVLLEDTDPFLTSNTVVQGSWVTTITGPWSSNPSGTLKWTKSGVQVSIWCESFITQTVTTVAGATITGLPPLLTPTSNRQLVCSILANNISSVGGAVVTPSNTILITQGPSFQNFTSGISGLPTGWSISYSV